MVPAVGSRGDDRAHRTVVVRLIKKGMDDGKRTEEDTCCIVGALLREPSCFYGSKLKGRC